MAKKKQKKRPSAATASAATAVETPRAEERPARVEAARKPLVPGSIGSFGAYLGMVFGLSLLVLGAIGGLRAETLPIPLIVALVIAGPLQVALCWQTLRRSRVAWSFAVALSGTAALVCLFSAPKIRDELGLSIGIAVLPSVVALVVTWLLASAADDVAQRS